MADDFAHLHLHSQYSLLDGAIRLGDLAPTIQARGMTSVAVTDHGNMFGALQHYKKAKAAGIKPIFGCEAYVAEGDAAAKTDRKNYHLVLLARNEVGFYNLQKLVSYGHTNGFYYNPRIDRTLLRKHREGLIGLSACLGGHISRLISEDGSGLDQARAAALEYRDIFEPDSYFLELQPSGTPRQELVNAKLAELGHSFDIPLVATNDCHYVDRAEAHAHEVLMCIGMGKTIDDPKRIAHGVDEFFIKTPEQMASYFTRYPDALDNARRIALACNVELKLGKPELPLFDLPDGAREDIPTYLRKIANEGLDRRLEEAARRGEQPVRKVYTDRIDYELEMIIKMGFAGYFLIVWDFIRHAKERGIPVGPGRGSGAGSLVAYSMRITDLDPIHYRLMFERFLNPERVSMPDFDIDLCMDRRQEVIDYVANRYGADRVGQIATFQGLLAKSVIKDVCRVKGTSMAEANAITKLLPDDGNCHLGLCLLDPIEMNAQMRAASKEEASKIAPVLESVVKAQRLRDACKADPKIYEIIRTGIALEGLTRHAGVHAAGIVIGNKPLVEVVPCWAQEGRLVTQYAMNDVEAAGLVKFDFLGLTTLTVIQRTLEQIHALPMDERPDPLSQTGAEFDLSAIPMDDRQVFEMLARGDTSGVFQFESSGMRSLLTRLKPDCFEDISAVGALYRPGPLEGGMVDQYVECKHGRKRIRYPHPLLEPILKDTYGVFVYQEQVITAAQILAGFTIAGADIMRRAMGKKKPQEMEEQRGKFIEGSVRVNGLSFKAAADIFALIDKFSGYGFNKCIESNTVITDAKTGRQRTVEDLHRNGHVGVAVHAVDKNGKLHSRRVSAVMSNGVKEVYELRTRRGLSIVATGNHRLLAEDGQWRNLLDFKPGELLATARHVQVSSRARWPKQHLIALGWLISEGSFSHPSCLYFYNNDRAAVRDFETAVRSFSDISINTYLRDERRWEVCVSSKSRGHGARSGLWKWVDSLGLTGKRSTNLSIPSKVLELCDEDLSIFMGRLWSGDGHISQERSTCPFYATSSTQLARDVYRAMHRLGIVTVIRHKEFKYRGGVRPGCTVHVVGDGSRSRFLDVIVPHIVGRKQQIKWLKHNLKCSGDSSMIDGVPCGPTRVVVRALKRASGKTWEEISAESGVSMREFAGSGGAKKTFMRSSVAALGDYFNSANLRQAATSDVYWDAVEAISLVGMRETYDIEIDVDHNFVANDGIIAHNSHSAAYGVISYHTAYLKRYYPEAFMAALMSCAGKAEKLALYVQGAISMGVRVLPPDINVSGVHFDVEKLSDGLGIRFGLSAVKDVGLGLAHEIVAARESEPFWSIFDLCDRVQMRKPALERLISVGALDSSAQKHGRSTLLASAAAAVAYGQKERAEKASGQGSLFSVETVRSQPAYVVTPSLSTQEQLQAERDGLGFYLGLHPLDAYEDMVNEVATAKISGLGAQYHDVDVKLVVVVSAIRQLSTKKGEEMAVLTVEDRTGTMEVVAFPRVWGQTSQTLMSLGSMPVVLAGRGDLRDSEDAKMQLVLDTAKLAPANSAPAVMRESMRVATFGVDESQLDDESIEKLKRIVSANVGSDQLKVCVTIPGKARVYLSLSNKVSINEGVMMFIERMFATSLQVEIRTAP